MKLIVLLMTISVLQVSAVSRAQNVSITVKQAALEDVFNTLHKQTGYNFIYNSNMLENTRPVNIDVKNTPLKEVLNTVFAGQPISYVIEDKTVVITTPRESPDIAISAVAIPVTGTVVDNKGATLPGVTVKVKGTNMATSTDANGVFRLSLVTGNETLVFSFIGYRTQEISATGKTTFSIRMEESTSGLDEVVVIGYGTVKKRDLTGAVSSVKSADIALAPVSNPIEALEGRVAGLDIQRSSGQAGANPSIQLRGVRSITANGDPIYIIDGIQGDITALNPNDIESIDVLKDASSTAIYGSAGANGVIIVTTKKAKAGKLQVDVDSYYGINGFSSYPRPLQGDAWIQYLKDKYYGTNGSYPPSIAALVSALSLPAAAATAINNNQYVDWTKETLKRGSQQNHHISLRGGSEKVQGYFSLGYIDEKGIYKGDDLKSYNTRSGVDMQFGKILKAGIQNTINWRDNNTTNSRVNKAFGILPIGTPYNADGSVNLYPIGDGVTVSPIANYAPGVYVNNIKNLNAAFNPYLEIDPIHNLTIRSNLSVMLGYQRNGLFDNQNSYNSASTSATYKEATYSTNFAYGYLWENIINYNFDINRDHHFVVTGITSLGDNKNETSTIYAQGLDYDNYLYYNQGAATIKNTVATGYKGTDKASFAGRINYSYKGKYLLTVSDRYDGASQLVHKWSNFPSFAAGWRISDEDFMKNTKSWLSNLKLRGGYGVTGNANISAYVSTTNVVSNSSSTPITLGGNASTSLPVYIPGVNVANPDLTWERTYNTNIGLDLGLLNERIEVTAEAYYSHTDGLLYNLPLPSTLGGLNAKSPYLKLSNIGNSVNRGLELTATAKVISTKNFTWNSTLTYTIDREKLTAINLGNAVAASQYITANLFIGQPIIPVSSSGGPGFTLFNYKKIGIWQSNEATEAAKYGAKPGDVKLATIPIIKNGVSDNGVHTYSANDRMLNGHINPNWFGGWQNTFTYKNFDLTVYINARWGNTLNNAQLLGYFNSIAQPAYYNYWTPGNPSNYFPQPTILTSSIQQQYYQSLAYVDGSYVKVKTINLGYTIPAKISKKAAISKLRFYATAYNPFIYAKSPLLRNVDPETGGSDSFPLYKQLVFGMNLSF